MGSDDESAFDVATLELVKSQVRHLGGIIVRTTFGELDGLPALDIHLANGSLSESLSNYMASCQIPINLIPGQQAFRAR